MAKNIYENFNETIQTEVQNLSIKILEWCNENKVSVTDLSEQIGLGHMTLRRITQHSDTYSPNIKILYPIAEFFKCTVLELLSDKYPLNITYFSTLSDLKDNLNSKEVREMMPKSIYLRAKYKQFVKINYYNDLIGIFLMTNELPKKILSPIGCIIAINDVLHFGYLTLGKKISKFHDFTLMKNVDLETETISIIGIKESSIEYLPIN